jgi:hypothetical protein
VQRLAPPLRPLLLALALELLLPLIVLLWMMVHALECCRSGLGLRQTQTGVLES